MAMSFDFLIQSSPVAEFIEEVKIVDGFQNFNKPDNKRRVYLG